ncbi:MAG: M23 family metallopeptidase [Desulfomonile tiedjei]|uniref:M23 family metallopeptidase n=1 Tax=Desulfomonile tiedjei TaxID=2358 RepID=A0A9D6Z2U7_9BACT|nr:M23 family metallopeptidase [Desulfomonile tiedjei]
MDLRFTSLALILLPFIVSCSSSIGLTKKAPDLEQKGEPKLQVAQYNFPAVPPEQDGAFHIVGPGDTLRHVCGVYGLDVEKVARINRLLPPYTLKEGESIFLPAQALLAECQDKGTSSGRQTEVLTEKTAKKTVARAIIGKKDPLVPELAFPVPGGVLTSPFGYRWGRLHKGLDIAAPIGKPVLACADGRVIFTGSQKKFRRYGNTVLIDHGRGAYTYYAHLSEIAVKRNRQVRKGQKIGLVGNTGRSTGPHLHLEVRVANKMYNPLAYLSPRDLAGTMIAKRFSEPPMGPVRAGWQIPDLLADSH